MPVRPRRKSRPAAVAISENQDSAFTCSCVSSSRTYNIAMINRFRNLSGKLFVPACALALTLSCPAGPTHAHGIEVPFTIERNKIIVPVRIHNSRELKVILDTGMHFKGLLLYNTALDDSIALDKAIEVLVPGAGTDSGSPALMIDSGTFYVGEVKFGGQRMIMLQSDRMKGFPSDGVTGYSLFGDYSVEVDYDKMLITLHDPEELSADPSWGSIPLIFKDNMIPWIDAAININGEADIPVSLYIDLASGETLELLTRDSMKYALPQELEDSYLGRGLSGDIYGQKGRISSLKIGSHLLYDVATAFAPAGVRSKQAGADGVLGNNALRRFNLIFDYKNHVLYLKPNTHFSEPF